VKRAKNTTCDKHPLKAGTNTNNINTINHPLGSQPMRRKKTCVSKSVSESEPNVTSNQSGNNSKICESTKSNLSVAKILNLRRHGAAHPVLRRHGAAHRVLRRTLHV